MPTAREYLAALNRQIEQARLALDERRSLLRVMKEQREETEDAQRILVELQHILDEMIQLRDAVLHRLNNRGHDGSIGGVRMRPARTDLPKSLTRFPAANSACGTTVSNR